ncbi:MAG: hypothetical protein JWN32_1910 [Solirubrobacterales bacterium]|nr:hypothetical protein [Solirubrobacterales bacterium]
MIHRRRCLVGAALKPAKRTRVDEARDRDAPGLGLGSKPVVAPVPVLATPLWGVNLPALETESSPHRGAANGFRLASSSSYPIVRGT